MGTPTQLEPIYKTRIDTRDTIGVTVNADYKHSRIKQYLNCDVKSHAMSEYVGLEVQPMLKT